MEWTDWEARGLTEDDLYKLEGSEVISADDQRIGTINRVWSPMEEVEATTFRVKTRDHEVWVPLYVVREIGKDRVVLSATTEEIKEHDWTEPPPGWIPGVDEKHWEGGSTVHR